MGQFRGRGSTTAEEEEKPATYIEAEARIGGMGVATIKIPKNIFKATIEGKNNKYTYFIEYKDREVTISFSELKPGKYKIKLEPCTIEDFLKEFNETAKQKYGITLEIRGKTLILNLPNGGTLTTEKWIYEKEPETAKNKS